VDLSRSVGTFEEERTLFEVTVAGGPGDDTLARDVAAADADGLAREDLTLTVEDLVDDDGEAMDPSRVRLRATAACPTLGGVQTGNVDDDSQCEDVDGDGDADFDDAIQLAFNTGEAGDHVEAFDFDDDGDVDFDDAVSLAFEV
jgi:hypothetical protein